MTYLGKTDPTHLESTPIRVLHVDDDPDVASVTAEFLERESVSFEVVTESSARDGLDRLSREQVDCIVSDYEMPGWDGLEFLERVREDHQNLPFVLFTGKGSEEIASEAISAGVTDYLQKEAGTDQYTVLANRIENAVQQHRSRRAVEATERKLLQLAERTDDVLFMFDSDWEELLFINSAYEDIWPGTIDELRDDPESFLEYVHPDDRGKAAQSLERLQEGKSDAIEYRIVDDDGGERWVRGETKPIVDDDGSLRRITGFVRDITERKTREQELEVRATAIEAATDGIAILNEDREFVFVNEAHADIYGFDDPDQLYGESWRACYDPAEVDQFESEILPELAETGAWHGELTITAADGRAVHQDLTLKRLDDGRVLCVVRDITARKEREADLQRYKVLTENVTDNISVVGEDGTIQYESPAIERILGYEPAALEGELAFEYMHPEDRQDVMERFSALVSEEGSETARVQYRMRHADGSWRWLESEASGQTETALDGYVITSRDITRRKERERELEQYAAIVDSMADAAYIIGTDRQLVFANERSLADAGVSLSEIDGTPVMEVTRRLAATTADADRFEAALDRVMTADSTDETETVELRLALPSGEATVEQQLSPVDIDGDRKVVVTGRDITDRKRREETLQDLHTVTREFMEASDQQAVAEHAVTTAGRVLDQPLGSVWRHDGDDVLRPIAASDEARKLFDEIPTFERGGALAWEAFETGELAVYNDLRTEPDRYNADTPIGSEILLPLGEYGLMALGRLDPQQFSDIDVALARVLANTVEAALARADREAQLREQHRQLERQNERLDEFASIISHDLQNPLQVLHGSLEHAERTGEADHFERCYRAIDRMDRLISDVLTLARDGVEIGDPEPVDLNRISSECWHTVETRDATLTCQTDLTISADRSRLKQLLENLFGNAVTHGGDAVTVTVGDLPDGFYVADDGPGIPAADYDAVFDAGYSTTEEGTGFGLNIAEQVATAHGWEITVTESDAGGARFEITGVHSAKSGLDGDRH